MLRSSLLGWVQKGPFRTMRADEGQMTNEGTRGLRRGLLLLAVAGAAGLLTFAIAVRWGAESGPRAPEQGSRESAPSGGAVAGRPPASPPGNELGRAQAPVARGRTAPVDGGAAAERAARDRGSLWGRLTDPRIEVREEAVEALSERRDPESAALLEDFLVREADEDLKLRALELFEERPPEQAVPGVARAFDDRQPDVRAAAADTLALVGGREAIDTLWDAYHRERDPEVADEILVALEMLGEDVDPYLE